MLRRKGGIRRDHGAVLTLSRIKDPTPEAIERAAGIIRGGGLVAFPTETVFGLGADATNAMAVMTTPQTTVVIRTRHY